MVSFLNDQDARQLIKQTVTTLTSTAAAIADGSIADADTSFWNTLAEQTSRPAGEAEDE